MKKLTVILLILSVYLTSCAKIPGPVVINGTLETENTSKPETISLYQVTDGALSLLEEVSVDSINHFSFTFTFTPEYKGLYVIGLGRATIPQKKYRFYFEGGETLGITLKKNGYELTGEENSKENLMLWEWDKLSGEIAGIGIGYNGFTRETYRTFFPLITEFANTNMQWAESRHTGNKNFDALMPKLISYEITMWALNFILLPNREHPSEDDYQNTFYQTINRDDFMKDTTLLQMPFGFRTLRNLISLPSQLDRTIKHPPLDEIVKIIPNESLKRVFVLDKLSEIRSYSELMSFKEQYGEYITLPKDVATVQEKETNMLDELEAMSSEDFTFQDIKGNQVTLSDFKGKVVYLDIWATWCAPCRAEFPFLKEIEAKYHGNDGIVFIGISTDKPEDKAKWEQMLKDEQLPGIQLFAGGRNKIPASYNVTGIPRFIIFDRDGKVVESNAPRPSSKTLSKLLDELLK